MFGTEFEKEELTHSSSSEKKAGLYSKEKEYSINHLIILKCRPYIGLDYVLNIRNFSQHHESGHRFY